MALIVAVVEYPVLRLLLRIERALIGHIGGAHRRERGGDQQRTNESTGNGYPGHVSILPLNIIRRGYAEVWARSRRLCEA